MTDIEAFLDQAIRQGKVERTISLYAARRLKEAMGWIKGRISYYGLDGITPGTRDKIQQLRLDVEQYMQGNFADDLKAKMAGSEVLNDFIERQITLARDAVTSSGGTITPSLTSQQLINQSLQRVTISGIPWDEFVAVRLPRSVADKVARFVSLGMLDSEAKVVQAFDDAVVRTTKTQVEALIVSGVHDTGSIAQQLLWQIEADPAWQEDNELVWSALLDSIVCSTCIALDGERKPQGYIKVSPHPNCRCVMLPVSFFTQLESPTSKKMVPALRPAEGDDGELKEIKATKAATEAWLRGNEKTAKSILGERIGEQFVKGKISLDRAVKERKGR